jgi:DNA-binding Lrp family transcriptional regulator
MQNKERILNLLQENAKLNTDQISVMLGENKEDVEKVIKEFEDEGVIKGYKALVNWDKSDVRRATAIIEIRVTPQRDTGFDEIANRIVGFPEVESVYLVSGGFDLAVIVTAETMSDVAMFVAKRLAPIGGILSTATHFILSRYKDGGTVFNDEMEEIDERGSNLCD